MKKILLSLSLTVLLFACKDNADKGKFSVSGEIKNAPDQKVFLEELFFSDKPPEVLDTAEIVNGKFIASANATDMGLYRIRMEQTDAGFFFINDEKNILFTADMNNLSVSGPEFNTSANKLLKNFITNVDSFQREVATEHSALEQLKNTQATDSLINLQTGLVNEKAEAYKKYIITYLDTASNPVMAMIAIGHTRDIDPGRLKTPVFSLTNRFPGNEKIQSVVAQFKELVARQISRPQLGGIAPDFSLPDTSGKMISLSSYRGKYVLVDFWASWCGPCRLENPNVVAAYNQYRSKNFTVLGVSLDKEQQPWINAIAMDKLTWDHVCDYKFWNSPIVQLYNIDAIPYNVLVDPEGKILAIGLRGPQLAKKLVEVLK